LCSFVYIDNSHLDAEQEYAETSFINQHEELRFYINDDNIFGEYDELDGLNEDSELCASRSSDQMDNLGKINSNEIIYLLNHQKSATIPTILAELKELLCNNNNELDVLKVLIIRESHNAFSRVDCLCGIQNRTAFNLNESL
ncbi:20727_t:CDS:2, partial [Rhizophagus irregularis]